ncbi:unnamed protein product [Trichogramma brassicae]|uniref:Uncharacterized protein n=1 Tax=Trichogramma brassicae TaxID=86971 RepID=A0A6H5IKP2_9HYME|nr:unnamed protein product [Trichogramma brassicae]
MRNLYDLHGLSFGAKEKAIYVQISSRNYHMRNPSDLHGLSFGYKDEPYLHKDGKPLLSRVTPVHRAAILKNSNCVKELFKIFANCDVNYADECGSTHFHVACQYGYEDVVVKFLEHGQDPNCRAPLGGEPPLLLAARVEDEWVVELLLRNGADPNARNSSGSTALHIICKCYGDSVELLFEMLFELSDEKYHPVQIDAQDRWGKTPLHFAQLYGNTEMTEILLERGADPNAADKEGLTPLHFLCKSSICDKNKVELFAMLFELSNIRYQPVNINTQDKLGHTALHYALVSQNESLVKLLLSNGAILTWPKRMDRRPFTLFSMITGTMKNGR